MLWFELESRFRHDARIKRIREQFGKEGLATLFLLWGEVADKGALPGVGVDRHGDPLHLRDLAEATGLTVKRFSAFVDFLVRIGHVERGRWEAEGVVVFPAMVRRGGKVQKAVDTANRVNAHRERLFVSVADRCGGRKCVHCGRTDQLELERIVPKEEGGGKEPENLQITCVPCGRRRRAERTMRPPDGPRGQSSGPSVSAQVPRDTLGAPSGHPRRTLHTPTGSVLEGSETGQKSAGRNQDETQGCGRIDVQGTCTGTGEVSTDGTTHTLTRAHAFNGRLPLIGQVPPRAVRGLNPALGSPTLHGALPRDHANCFGAPRCGRVCLPLPLATQLARQLGGHEDQALARLEAFRVEVLASIPDDQEIGDEPFKFWRAYFAATFASAAPKAHAPDTRRHTPAPEPRPDMEWAEECRRLHDSTCGGQYRHHIVMGIEAERRRQVRVGSR